MRVAARFIGVVLLGLIPATVAAAPLTFYYPIIIPGRGIFYVPVQIHLPMQMAAPQAAPHVAQAPRVATPAPHVPTPQARPNPVVQAPSPKPVPVVQTPQTIPSTPTPAVTQAPAATTAPADISAYEQKVVVLINQVRVGQGLQPLKINATLMTVARTHSDNMVRYKKFDHTFDGNPGERMRAAGYTYRTYGENIFMGSAGAATPDQAVTAWMNSPGHRANILNPKFQETGVGVSRAPNGDLYYTQDFGTQ